MTCCCCKSGRKKTVKILLQHQWIMVLRDVFRGKFCILWVQIQTNERGRWRGVCRINERETLIWWGKYLQFNQFQQLSISLCIVTLGNFGELVWFCFLIWVNTQYDTTRLKMEIKRKTKMRKLFNDEFKEKKLIWSK